MAKNEIEFQIHISPLWSAPHSKYGVNKTIWSNTLMQNESSTKRASLNQINQILQSLSLSILFIFLEILYCYTLKKLKKKEKNFFCLPKFKFEIHFARWVESSQAKNDLQSLMNVDMRICSIKTSDFCTLFLFKLKILEILLDLKPTKKKKQKIKWVP